MLRPNCLHLFAVPRHGPQDYESGPNENLADQQAHGILKLLAHWTSAETLIMDGLVYSLRQSGHHGEKIKDIVLAFFEKTKGLRN